MAHPKDFPRLDIRLTHHHGSDAKLNCNLVLLIHTAGPQVGSLISDSSTVHNTSQTLIASILTHKSRALILP